MPGSESDIELVRFAEHLHRNPFHFAFELPSNVSFEFAGSSAGPSSYTFL